MTRRGRASLGALLLVVLLVCSVAVTAAPLATPAAGAQTRPQVVLREQTPFIGPTDTLTVKLDVRGAPEGALLKFSLLFPVTGNKDGPRQNLAGMLSGKTTNGPFQPGRTLPVALFPVNDDGTITASLTFASDDTDPSVIFRFGDPGVFPMTVTLLDGAEQQLDQFTTYVVKLPTARADAPPVEVATVISFHAPVARRPDGTIVIAAEDRTRLQALVDMLAKHPSLPITIAPTPETVEALDRSETTGGSQPTSAAVTAAMATHEVLSSTYVDLDASAWVRSGLTTELANQLSVGADTVQSHLQPSTPPDRRTWIGGPDLSADALARLGELGVNQVVIPETSVAPLDPKLFDTRAQQLATLQPFDIDLGNGGAGRLRGLTSDATVVDRLRTTDNPVLNAQIAIADLAVLSFGSLTTTPFASPESKKRSVVLTVPDDPALLPSLDAFLHALESSPTSAPGARPVIVPATLEEAFAADHAATPRTSSPLARAYQPTGDAGATMGTFPRQLEHAHQQINGYRSMVGSSGADRATRLDDLMRVAGAANLAPDQRQAYFDAVSTTIDVATQAVSIPNQDQVTLTSSDAVLPIQIENALDYPVDVKIVLASEKLKFDSGATVTATLQPGLNKVPVPVKAPSFGETPVEVKVQSPDASLTLASSTVPVRSTVVSGLGLVLSVGAGIFLAIWWARNARSARRAKKLVDADPTGPTPPSHRDDPDADDPTAGSAGTSNAGQSLPV